MEPRKVVVFVSSMRLGWSCSSSYEMSNPEVLLGVP
jgi:hypothetical protein